MITIKNIRQRLAYIESIMHLYEAEHQALTELAKVYDDPKYHDVRELVETIDQSSWAPPEPTPTAFVPTGSYKLTSAPTRRSPKMSAKELDDRILAHIFHNSPLTATQQVIADAIGTTSNGRVCESLYRLNRDAKINQSGSRPTTYTYVRGIVK